MIVEFDPINTMAIHSGFTEISIEQKIYVKYYSQEYLQYVTTTMKDVSDRN